MAMKLFEKWSKFTAHFSNKGKEIQSKCAWLSNVVDLKSQNQYSTF